MNIWRIAGLALMIGLGLFLLSVIVKLLIVAAVAALIFKIVGKQIARRYYGHGNVQGGPWAPATSIISIDNPSYRQSAYQASYERIISIN